MLSTYRSLFLVMFTLSALFTQAQHCSDAAVDDNGASSKIRNGGGFVGSYSLPCIMQGTYTEVAVPFKVFTTVPRGNSDDVVHALRIESIANLPDGMCWVSSRANNTFLAGEGGLLMLRGITNDNIGQFGLDIKLSFDTTGDGAFDRTDVNYNKVSNTGKMILRVTNASVNCEDVDYEAQSNVAGGLPNTASK